MLNQRHSFLKGCVYFKSKYIIMLWKSRSLIFWKWDKSENHSYPRMSMVSRNTKNNSMDIWQRLLLTRGYPKLWLLRGQPRQKKYRLEIIKKRKKWIKSNRYIKWILLCEYVVSFFNLKIELFWHFQYPKKDIKRFPKVIKKKYIKKGSANATPIHCAIMML